MTVARASLAFLAAGVAVMQFACSDPLHDELVESLGPEAPSVPPGPLHRPGQPCLTCHGGLGPASLQFSLGGTVYAVRGQEPAEVGAFVYVEDITGKSWQTIGTNSAGNFFVELTHFAPNYPIRMTLEYPDGGVAQRMQTYANRADSCSDCHTRRADSTSPGPIYLVSVVANDGGAP